MNYNDFKSEVNDRIANSYFSDSNGNEILRATNHALRDIQNGKIAGNPRDQIDKRRIGYNFQKEETDLSYVVNTVRYDLSTIITVADLKWVDDILIDTNENFTFTKRNSIYFRRRRGVNNSIERNFAEEYQNGTKNILIYNPNTETLNVVWYSNYLVKSSEGVRAQYLPTSNNGNYEFLIPDEFIDCVIDLTVANLYLQDRNEQSNSANTYFNQGRTTLQSMINSIGKREKKPVNQLKPKSEWGMYDNLKR